VIGPVRSSCRTYVVLESLSMPKMSAAMGTGLSCGQKKGMGRAVTSPFSAARATTRERSYMGGFYNG